MADAEARPWRRALLRWGGLVLLAACLVYLAKALAGLDLDRLIATLGWREWLVTGICAMVYGGSLALLAQGWAALADIGRTFSPFRAVAVYGPGAIAKYFPGAVLQYASRQALGRREGLAHGSMARATVIEAALHVAISLALAGGLMAAGAWAPLAGAVLAAALLAWRKSALMTSLAWQAAFFAIFAGIVLVLASFGGVVADPPRLAGLFFVAWVAGYLVPIAPGGIGVREAALLALAVPYETTDAIALVALLARLVGIVGDGLFGLAGYVAAARLNRQASA